MERLRVKILKRTNAYAIPVFKSTMDMSQCVSVRERESKMYEIEEIEIAMRDLNDERADGLITKEAFVIRRMELREMLKTIKEREGK